MGRQFDSIAIMENLGPTSVKIVRLPRWLPYLWFPYLRLRIPLQFCFHKLDERAYICVIVVCINGGVITSVLSHGTVPIYSVTLQC